mmetsp:Transcript_34324/g.97232  ORF Transcript_34324/g.97232 Transcript_34324/m.97232 type:complete len:321 (-) Transcript_34324:75-1037(-)|eukprot:CAMPEP_0117664126 /NCGR_PEP_ID=MMETSP0804-20121206/9029_1 /TAXON_ID=1074897 /ORGANISM="Tetraselmis astigmatica, Strain CCMP880" /LENGTH=320 /DNA_ID=CAMNT_0005471289 /DNA_START=218 /DNA_END=1180 /DNA_ORIENTATION=+
MKDLLGAVKMGAEETDEGIGRYKVGGDSDDVEAQNQDSRNSPAETDSSQDKAMADFFNEVAQVKQALTTIKKNKRAMNDLHEKSKTISRSNIVQQLQQDMQASIKEVQKAATMAKAKIELLDRMNSEASQQPGNEPGSSNHRMRQSVTNGLKKKLKEMMGDFQQLRTKIQEEYREVVERRVTYVTGAKPSEDQLDRMIETGEGETIFKKAILEAGRGSIVDTLAEIQERHSAVKELERSLLELHQLFLDMAVLVEAQGEMLDNIENQVGKAKDYVAKGAQNLVQARELQKSTRKYMCWAIICFVILAVIIFVVIGGLRLF